MIRNATPRRCRLGHRWTLVSDFYVAVFPLGRYLGAVGRRHRATVHRCQKCLLSRTIRVSTQSVPA